MTNRLQDNLSNVFITGVTGVLGGRLLQELLQTTNAHIHCLIRAEDYQHAMERIGKILFVYDHARSLEKDLYLRVSTVLGDITQPTLDLDSGSYDLLRDSMDVVIHSAANVSLMKEYEELRPINVTGTEHIIQFCLEGDIPLLHISTYAVIGDKIYEEGFVFKESDLDVGQVLDESFSYERTKYEAEQLVHAAGKEGLSFCIARPGNIFGDSVTGAYPLFETTTKGIYYDIFKGIVVTGYSMENYDNVDITPVDYVAKGALCIAQSIETLCSSTFHLVNPEIIIYKDLMDLITEYGYVNRIIPEDDYFEAILEDRMILDGEPFYSAFTTVMASMPDEVGQEVALFDTSRTTALLSQAGIICAKPDIKLLSTYFNFCIQRNYLPSPENQGPLAEIIPESESKPRENSLFYSLM